MQLAPIYEYAKPGDIILTGSNSLLSLLIRNGQRIHTVDHKPSLWSHCVMYQDEMTIIESTIDYLPYIPTGKRMDNGMQMNDLSTLRDYGYGELFCFGDLISNAQRQAMLNRGQELIADPKNRYDITGLFGSLLTYYVLRWMKSNPLSTGLYCSAYMAKLLGAAGLDPHRNTSKNTNPEMLYQWLTKFGCMKYWLAESA